MRHVVSRMRRLRWTNLLVAYLWVVRHAPTSPPAILPYPVLQHVSSPCGGHAVVRSVWRHATGRSHPWSCDGYGLRTSNFFSKFPCMILQVALEFLFSIAELQIFICAAAQRVFCPLFSLWRYLLPVDSCKLLVPRCGYYCMSCQGDKEWREQRSN